MITQLGGDKGPPAPTDDEPVILASYVAGPEVKAYLECAALGAALPLFLHPDRYINVPLETTYQTAYPDTPQFWRDVLEAAAPIE